MRSVQPALFLRGRFPWEGKSWDKVLAVMANSTVLNFLLELFRQFYRIAPVDLMLWTLHLIEFSIYTVLALVEYFALQFPPSVTIIATLLSFCIIRAIPLFFFHRARRKYASPRPSHIKSSKIDQIWAIIWGYTTFILLYTFLQPLDRFVTPLLESDCSRLNFRGGNYRERLSGVKYPVLLVHGFCCNSMFWLPTRAYLGWMGVSSIFTVTLSPCLGDIMAYAQTISDKVDAILEETGAEKVIVVGHSMGGIAARYYIQNLNGFLKIEKLIALASPHHGTKPASWEPWKLFKLERSCIQQMAWGSSFLEMLNRVESNGEEQKVPITDIFSYDDEIVTPQESSILEVCHEKQVPCSGVTHLSMPFSPMINRLIFKELTETDSES